MYANQFSVQVYMTYLTDIFLFLQDQNVYLSCLASICSPTSTYLSSACFCEVPASTTSFHLLYFALP
jgi:hypothetical protein